MNEKRMKCAGVVPISTTSVPNQVWRTSQKYFIVCSQNPISTPRYIRQNLTRMAQSWDNEPVGLGLRPSCLQDIYHPPQSSNSFLSINQFQPVPPSSISPFGSKHNLEWSQPNWLSKLCQIIDLTVRCPESLPKETPNGSRIPTLLPSCTIKQQSPTLRYQTGEEAVVQRFSKETEYRYVRLSLFTFLTTLPVFIVLYLTLLSNPPSLLSS